MEESPSLDPDGSEAGSCLAAASFASSLRQSRTLTRPARGFFPAGSASLGELLSEEGLSVAGVLLFGWSASVAGVLDAFALVFSTFAGASVLAGFSGACSALLVAFLAVAFLATVFFAVAFLATFFVAFLAVAFLAVVFLAAFLATFLVAFFAAFLAGGLALVASLPKRSGVSCEESLIIEM